MNSTLSELCENEQVKTLIMEDMIVWAKDAGLKPFEQVNLDQILKLFVY